MVQKRAFIVGCLRPVVEMAQTELQREFPAVRRPALLPYLGPNGQIRRFASILPRGACNKISSS
jgi:hypothetical protein